MKRVTFLLGVVAVASPALSQTYTQGYTRSDGTYVAPHYSSSPDSTRLNNWSTQGNVNPYTGRAGTLNPYSTPSYGSRTRSYGNYGSSYGSDSEASSYGSKP